MKGKLYCVSVGPGDPELITVKALRIINDCPVTAAPRTSCGKMLALSIAEQAADLSGKTIIPLDFQMTKDETSLGESHNNAAKKLAGYLNKGVDIAMLCLGDASLYSTCSYIAQILQGQGYETEVCAGVTSFCAAAAALGISLAEKREPLLIMPADCENADELLSLGGNKVIMKLGNNSEKIAEALKQSGHKVYAAENCGLDGQRLHHDIGKLGECGYFTVVIAK